MTTCPDGIFDGNDTVTPNLVYSMTKDSAKKVCKAYSTNYGMDITIVRFFNIFQASFSSFHFISGDYARQRWDSDSFQLLEYNLRDYVFSADLTALLKVILVKEKKYNVGVFNACSGV
jgi:nucleoside-diphosphate-sugar epimerase